MLHFATEMEDTVSSVEFLEKPDIRFFFNIIEFPVSHHKGILNI